MPTVMVIGPYRFFFYSSDGDEPRHMHVERDESIAKVWLEPVCLQSSGGFARSEINRVISLVVEYRETFIHAWIEFFGT